MSGGTRTASIVIPHAGRRELLNACLAGVRHQSVSPLETLVVLTVPQSRESLDLASGEAAVLAEGAGFAAAANIGASLARGETIAILNDDAIPHEFWLEEALACLSRHPVAASVATKVLRHDQSWRLDGAGDELTLSLKAYRRGQGERDGPAYDREEEVFSASGTACLWRTDVFRALGGYDERFFAYYEDVDLGFRARLSGYECWYAPAARVAHVGGASAGTRAQEFEWRHAVRNRWATALKNAPRRWLLSHSPTIFAAEVAAFGRALLAGEGGRVVAAYAEVVRIRRELRAERPPNGVPYQQLRRVVRRRFPPLRTSLLRVRRPAATGE